MFRTMWRKLFRRSNTPQRTINKQRALPQLARLEDRTVPAFNLSLSLGATVGVNVVTVAGTTTFTANAAGANVDWGDIQGQLVAGKNVVVNSGTTGTEAGNITDLTGIQMPGLAANASLTFQTGTGANLVGDVLIIGCFMQSTNASFTITANHDIAIGLIGAGTNATPLPLAIATYTSATGSVMRGGVIGPTFADKLAITAVTGIGTAAIPLFGQVNNIEAQTATGGVFFTNAKALTIGGVSGALNGVQNTGASGAIQIDASGSITVSEKVRAPGNITLNANGAASDLTNQSGIDGIRSTGGTTTLQAGQNVVLGTATNFGDTSGQKVVLTAGGDIVVDNITFVQADGAGGVQGTAGGNFKLLQAISAGSLVNSNGNGPISITTGTGQSFILDGGAGAQMATNGGSITISADDMVINNKIIAGTKIVTLQQASATARLISLGGGAAAGALGISDAELALITASVLRIGRTDNPGDISLDGEVTTHVGYSTMSLLTGGAIRDDFAGTDINVVNLALQAAKGIGDAGAFTLLDIQVTNVAFANSTSGLTQVKDAGGGLTIASVDTITAKSNAAKGGSIVASSPLTIAMDVLVGGSMLFVAGDSAAAGDDLTIKTGVTVTLDSAVNSTLSFIAGDDIVFEGTGNVLTKNAGGHKVQLSADNENNTAEDGGTITQDTAATVCVTTNILEITPRASIGTAATRFFFSTDSITTTSTLGSQFLRELNGVTAVALTANGAGNDIDLIVDAGDLAVGTITAADTVTLKATAGKITDANAGATNITAIDLFASAATGIDLDTKVDTITATTTGAGAISLDEFDGVTLTNVNSADGAITITSGGNTTITNVVSTTDTDANDISITAATGDATVTTVNAGAMAGDVNIKATAGSIFDDGVNATLITGDVVTLTADRAIGQPGAVADMDTAANSWILNTTGPGPFVGAPTPGIWVTDTGTVTVTNAATVDGVILLASAGTMTVTTVNAGGTGRNVRLLTTAGDIVLGTVSAAGDSVLLQTTGAIVDNNAGNNVTAGNLEMKAATGIGAGNAIESTVNKLAAVSTAGSIEVANSIALTVEELTTFGLKVTGVSTPDDVILSVDDLTIAKAITGDCVIIQTNSDNTVNARLGANAAGELSLDQAELDLITANIFQFGGSLAGANRSKSITIAAATAINNAPTLDLRTAGTISDNAGAGSIKATNLAFAAGDTVTLNGTNDVNVLAGTTTKGDILFRDTDDVTIGNVTVCDSVVNQLTAPGKIMITADAPDITITVIGDCVIIDTNAVGNIDLGTTLDNTDLGNITARVLQIGNTNAQDITVSAAITISAAKVTNVNLVAQKNATTTGGTIATGNLAIDALGGKVNFVGGNDIVTLAGKATTSFAFVDSNAVTVGSVELCDLTKRDGVTGTSVELTAGSISVAKAVTATTTDILLTADAMDLAAAVDASNGCVTLVQNSVATPIDLGTETAGQLSLRDSELDFVVTKLGLSIGQKTGGAINVSNIISIDDNLELLAGAGGIGGVGSLQLKNLLLNSGGSVNLTGANKLDVVAGQSATDFTLTNAQALTVGSVTVCTDTKVGVTAVAGGVTLNTAKLLTLAASVTGTTTLTFNPSADGVTQTAGAVTGNTLRLLGVGAFTINQPTNEVVNFTTNVTGAVSYRDATGITAVLPGILTNGGDLNLNLGLGFTIDNVNDTTANAINLGAGKATIQTGTVGAAVNTLSAKITASKFTISSGTFNDSFVKVRPSETTPLTINGNLPNPPAFPGDSLSTLAVPTATITFVYDPITGNGSIDYGGVRQKITFTSIEAILGLSIQTVVTQTGNNVSTIEAIGTLNGQPLTGGLTDRPPTAPPFLVAPSFADPNQPFKAPSLSVGDIDGDGVPDLIIGNGPNFGGPLVSVISGQRILFAANANAPTSQFLLAQFFAYDPTFNGGVYVAAADILPDPVGKRAEIITGAGQNGGPHVVVFQLTGTANPLAGKMLTVSKGPQFFAYDASFRGGVRVAAGDVNGDGVPDVVTAAGPGGGPHVKIISGKSLQMGGASVAGEFFAYAANFRGGVFVDVADVANGVNSFTPDGFADIATGAGYGGGPHVKVIDGKRITQPAPIVQTDFEFFDAPFVVPGVPTPFEEGVFTLTAGVSGVGFSDADGDGLFDLYVGSGLGRKSRFRIYKMGNTNPINGLAGTKVANSDLNYGVFIGTSGANLG